MITKSYFNIHPFVNIIVLLAIYRQVRDNFESPCTPAKILINCNYNHAQRVKCSVGNLCNWSHCIDTAHEVTRHYPDMCKENSLCDRVRKESGELIPAEEEKSGNEGVENVSPTNNQLGITVTNFKEKTIKLIYVQPRT